jgi:hypothetical protein
MVKNPSGVASVHCVVCKLVQCCWLMRGSPQCFSQSVKNQVNGHTGILEKIVFPSVQHAVLLDEEDDVDHQLAVLLDENTTNCLSLFCELGNLAH